MEIHTYDSEHLPERDFLLKFQEKQVLCWGNEPFCEFHLCSECGRIHSINELNAADDVVNGVLRSYSCVECGSDTETFYQWENFLQEIRDYFSNEIQLIVAQEESEIIGYLVLVRKKIADLLKYELATRPEGHNSWLIIQKVWEIIPKDSPLLCMQHMYIQPMHRGKDFFTKLLRIWIQSFWIEQDEAVIMETHFWSEVYPLSRSLWFENISHDKYGYTVELHPSKNKLFERLWKINPRGEFRKEQKRILSENPQFSEKRLYI